MSESISRKVIVLKETTEDAEISLWIDVRTGKRSLDIDCPLRGFEKRKNVEKLYNFIGEILKEWPTKKKDAK